MGLRDQHRHRDEQAAKERYAQAARNLRRLVTVEKQTDPTMRRMSLVLYAAASVLEAASHNLPTDRMMNDAVVGLAEYVERLD